MFQTHQSDSEHVLRTFLWFVLLSVLALDLSKLEAPESLETRASHKFAVRLVPHVTRRPVESGDPATSIVCLGILVDGVRKQAGRKSFELQHHILGFLFGSTQRGRIVQPTARPCLPSEATIPGPRPPPVRLAAHREARQTELGMRPWTFIGHHAIVQLDAHSHVPVCDAHLRPQGREGARVDLPEHRVRDAPLGRGTARHQVRIAQGVGGAHEHVALRAAEAVHVELRGPERGRFLPRRRVRVGFVVRGVGDVALGVANMCTAVVREGGVGDDLCARRYGSERIGSHEAGGAVLVHDVLEPLHESAGPVDGPLAPPLPPLQKLLVVRIELEHVVLHPLRLTHLFHLPVGVGIGSHTREEVVAVPPFHALPLLVVHELEVRIGLAVLQWSRPVRRRRRGTQPKGAAGGEADERGERPCSRRRQKERRSGVSARGRHRSKCNTTLTYSRDSLHVNDSL
mmetsp:Transcript_7496/g.15537  ORF Transcript_7496/g.15537 Transcript_7496/m.15537 type:complete len:457 (+) Transcript_7496:180-1550(+)